MDRRQFVAAAAVGGLGLSAGCLDAVFEDATSFAASPAVVSQTAVDDAGYEYQGTQEVVETTTIAGQTVEATNYASEYTRTIDALSAVFGDDAADAGVFGVATTPQVGLLGEQFNPIDDMSNAEIVGHVQDQYDELTITDGVVQRRTAETLGQELTVETFDGEAALHDVQDVDVYVDVSQSTHEDDHVVIIGVYPNSQGLQRESEAERTDTLIEGLEHGDGVDAELVDD